MKRKLSSSSINNGDYGENNVGKQVQLQNQNKVQDLPSKEGSCWHHVWQLNFQMNSKICFAVSQERELVLLYNVETPPFAVIPEGVDAMCGQGENAPEVWQQEVQILHQSKCQMHQNRVQEIMMESGTKFGAIAGNASWSGTYIVSQLL